MASDSGLYIKDTIIAMAEGNKVDWKKIADARGTGIPDAQLAAVSPTLDALEKAFRPLQATLKPDDDLSVLFVADQA
jgi:hypothetical protein